MLIMFTEMKQFGKDWVVGMRKSRVPQGKYHIYFYIWDVIAFVKECWEERWRAWTFRGTWRHILKPLMCWLELRVGSCQFGSPGSWLWDGHEPVGFLEQASPKIDSFTFTLWFSCHTALPAFGPSCQPSFYRRVSSLAHFTLNSQSHCFSSEPHSFHVIGSPLITPVALYYFLSSIFPLDLMPVSNSCPIFQLPFMPKHFLKSILLEFSCFAMLC